MRTLLITLLSLGCLFVLSTTIVSGQAGEASIIYIAQLLGGGGYECGSIQADGSDLTVLESEFDPANLSPLCHGALSPNGGQWLILKQLEGETVLQVVDAESGNARDLHFEAHPAISHIRWLPDSQSAIFISQETRPVQYASGTFYEPTENWAVQRLNLNDDSIETVAQFSDQNAQPSIHLSPDGEYFLVRRDDEGGRLYRVGIHDSGGTSLIDSNQLGYCPSWSPEGAMLAFDYYGASSLITISASSANARSGPGQSFGIINTFAAGTELEVLEQQGGWFKVMNADGQEVWVSDTVVTQQGSLMPTVEVMRADGTEQRSLAPGFNPVWSPDGSAISLIDLSRQALLLVTPQGEMTGAFPAENIQDAYWSPDGKKIAYQSWGSDPGSSVIELHILNVETSQDVIVSEDVIAFTTLWCDSSPAVQWSSSGDQLLYRITEPSPENPNAGTGDYKVCDLAGCARVRELSDHFTEDVRIFSAHWAPTSS